MTPTKFMAGDKGMCEVTQKPSPSILLIHSLDLVIIMIRMTLPSLIVDVCDMLHKKYVHKEKGEPEIHKKLLTWMILVNF